jgi:alpha-L-fucosidase
MDNNPVFVPDKWKWFVHDRFGMFIHWGTYALGARHEWLKANERIKDEDYQKYFDMFDPDLYDPEEWASYAKAAGMKYFVITTKHHEGFCLWDTKYTDYKAPNTPYGKDLIRPMVDAFRAEGIKVGFYHSLIDWHHPDFPIDSLHPMTANQELRETNPKRDVKKYAQYLYNQVEELLTNYGQIDYLFFDFSYPGDDGKGRDDWQSEKLIAMCRKCQPNIIINDRLNLEDVEGGYDFVTPEQSQEREWPTRNGKRVLWETCQTFSGSWGYHRDETGWKSFDQLVKMLIDTVSRGGNLLLNVGPTARGEFDVRAEESLLGMGEWMRLHGRSIYGCTEAPNEFPQPQDCRLTYNPDKKRLYVHMYSWPIGEIAFDGFADKVAYCQLLNDASELSMHPSKGDNPRNTLEVRLPTLRPNVQVPVIEMYLK